MSIRQTTPPSDAAPPGTPPAAGDGDRSGGPPRRRWVVAGAVAAIALVAATIGALVVGDDNDEVAVEEPTTAAPTTTGTEEPAAPSGAGTTEARAGETMALTIYFLDEETLVPVEVTVTATEAVARAAMTELLKGPEAAGAGEYGSVIPAGTRLLDIAVEDGVATVDLSSEFGSGGGSVSMGARVAQVVYTLTEFDTVEAVSFWMDGEPVEALGGEGLIVDEPQTRADWAQFAPRGDTSATTAPGQSFVCPEGGMAAAEEIQRAVDEGHQPWWLNPEDVASFCVLGSTGGQVDELGANTYRVTDTATGEVFTVGMTQPVRQGPSGIWAVVSTTPTG